MRIIGIDPGLASTGYGIIDFDGTQSRMLEAGCIITGAAAPLAQRLQQIHDQLAQTIEHWHPDVASMELLFFCTNIKTAIAVAQGRGVAILATAKAQIPLAEYTPLQIKQAVTGSGKASKSQVERMVKTILGLAQPPATSHAADALAAALCHAHSFRYNQMVSTALASRRRSGSFRSR